jgi:hypothetical protein
LVGVDRLMKWTALLLLALWMPVTAHCKLEVLPGLGFLACSEGEGSVPHQEAGCEQDGCATVESGDYRVEYNPPLTFPPLSLLLPLNIDLRAAEPLAPDLSLGATHLGPPEILKTWQFFCRAALSPRAPSFIG